MGAADFRACGYRAVSAITARAIEEEPPPLLRIGSNRGGILAGLRIAFDAPNGMFRMGEAMADRPYCRGNRHRRANSDMRTHLAVTISAMATGLTVANFCALELEKRWIAMPPFNPYAVADFLVEPAWRAAAEPQAAGF